jgi:hypothetical protein
MEDLLRLQYYSNVTRFSNVRTFLALLRTCAVFVGLAIYLKNKYIFLLVVALMIFGMAEYVLINKKLSENNLKNTISSYNNLVLIYSGIFILIFILLFIYPPF